MECSRRMPVREERIRSCVSFISYRRVASIIKTAIRHFLLDQILPNILDCPVENRIHAHQLGPTSVSLLKEAKFDFLLVQVSLC